VRHKEAALQRLRPRAVHSLPAAPLCPLPSLHPDSSYRAAAEERAEALAAG
jgi:hypothetical protein